MSQFSEPGTWQIELLQLRDVVANQQFLNTSNLMALGLPVNLTVAADPSDTTPPQLTGLISVPTVINTSTGDQLVRVTLDTTDHLAARPLRLPLSSSPFSRPEFSSGVRQGNK